MARPIPSSRSITQLKKNILNPSTTSNYICRFSPPGNVGTFLSSRLGGSYYSGDNQDLIEISCSEASLPGSSLATYDIDNAYHGVSEKMAYRKIYDDRADFTFIVDRDYYAIKFFENWISYIVGEENLNSLVNQNYSYKVKYPKDYRTDNLYITKFEKDYPYTPQTGKTTDSSLLTYKFIGAYPISIVSMPISYDQSQLLKCTVSFTYLRYVVNPGREPIEPPDAGDANDGGGSLPDIRIQNISLNQYVGNTSGEDQRFIPTDNATGFRGDGSESFLLPDGSPVRDANGQLREVF